MHRLYCLVAGSTLLYLLQTPKLEGKKGRAAKHIAQALVSKKPTRVYSFQDFYSICVFYGPNLSMHSLLSGT